MRYIDIDIYTSRGHKERLPGEGQLLVLHESKQEKSSWFCMGVKSKYAFFKRADGQHTTCKEEEKGLQGLCNMPSIKKKTNQQTTTRERKEGEGVHALPQGNVITMLGSQLTVSG